MELITVSVKVKDAEFDEAGVEVTAAQYAEFQFREPDFQVLKKAITHLVSNDFVSAGEAILTTCYAKGDKELLNRPSIKLAICGQLATLVEVADATIKKK